MSVSEDLQIKSLELRKQMLGAIYQAGAGHTGGSLSCLDILIVLYNRILRISPERPDDPDRDRYVQSKGHSVEALYVVLSNRGFFPAAELDTLCQYQSHFVGHPTRKIPGIEQNTGALGHGLPIAVGMAIAGKLDNKDYRVFTLLGDGELAEGSNWEAAMAASHYKLDNLTAILDVNTLQITGRTCEVMNHEPLEDKFRSFGWAVTTVDGHDFQALEEAMASPLEVGKPTVVITRTTKGKGVSFMEDVGSWHHGVPSEEQLQTAMAELDKKLEAAKGRLTT
ncbi:MAG: transketolase [Puniceicoccaceae bacterium]